MAGKHYGVIHHVLFPSDHLLWERASEQTSVTVKKKRKKVLLTWRVGGKAAFFQGLELECFVSSWWKHNKIILLFGDRFGKILFLCFGIKSFDVSKEWFVESFKVLETKERESLVRHQLSRQKHFKHQQK